MHTQWKPGLFSSLLGLEARPANGNPYLTSFYECHILQTHTCKYNAVNTEPAGYGSASMSKVDKNWIKHTPKCSQYGYTCYFLPSLSVIWTEPHCLMTSLPVPVGRVTYTWKCSVCSTSESSTITILMHFLSEVAKSNVWLLAM